MKKKRLWLAGILCCIGMALSGSAAAQEDLILDDAVLESMSEADEMSLPAVQDGEEQSAQGTETVWEEDDMIPEEAVSEAEDDADAWPAADEEFSEDIVILDVQEPDEGEWDTSVSALTEMSTETDQAEETAEEEEERGSETADEEAEAQELTDEELSGEEVSEDVSEETVLRAGSPRTKITSIVLQAGVPIQAAFGQQVYETTAHYQVTMTSGSPAWIQSAVWLKKEGSSWVEHKGGYFTAGDWKFRIRFRIDGSGADNYELADTTTLKVNGVNWTIWEAASVTTYVSTIGFVSPEYHLTESSGTPLTFFHDDRRSDQGGMNIPENFVGKAIKEFDLADFVVGGTKPYTFTKVSGPSWISVSSSGKVTGTPTKTGTNSNLVVKVTDHAGDYKQVSATVDKTRPDPAARTVISKVTANATGLFPVYGQSVLKPPVFTITSGLPAQPGGSANSWWEYKEAGGWIRPTDGYITEGVWRYHTQIGISEAMVNGMNSDNYVLDYNTEFVVNGVSMIRTSSNIHSTYSYVYFVTPEIRVFSSTLTVENGTFTTNTQPPVSTGKVWPGQAVTLQADDPPSDRVFARWDITVGYGFTLKDKTAAKTTFTVPESRQENYALKAVYLKPISKAVITLEGGDSYFYTGEPIKPAFTVKYNGNTLKPGTDFTYSWYKNQSPGTASLTLTGKGDYTGTLKKTFTIKKRPIKGAKVTGLKTQSYTGEALKPVPSVTLGGKTLVRGTDYTLAWTKNINVGWGHVKITGKGIYTGTIEKTFKIIPKASYIRKLTPKNGKVTVVWKKRTAQTSGYQIQYSLSPTLASGRRTKTIYDPNQTSFTTIKLKKGKTYYFRVRTFKKVSGKTYLSKWSKIKKVTVP